MVQKEWIELISQLKLEKQCKGLIYDDFEEIMVQHGFAKPNQLNLLSKVFLAATNFQTDPKSKIQKKVPLLSMSDFKALIYCTRNLYDLKVLQDKVVNCAGLMQGYGAKFFTETSTTSSL